MSYEEKAWLGTHAFYYTSCLLCDTIFHEVSKNEEQETHDKRQCVVPIDYRNNYGYSVYLWHAILECTRDEERIPSQNRHI